ncbi:hypothetical protein [Methylobacterium brachiatum]|jgi:hypothetical protein|uniref:hypothetical protein n=1 Tax=Methylobacterium brachiatum TaxID=269660 RepID=UPI0008DF61CF|nr:hypothetical protein [Methylobacterium brachiatum]MDF2602564.1 hypothetical protein [Methylobacterium brachiatum]SFJ18324.1 hypothetical protein SAMN02799642_03749 [Methylobacterium brachiatum]
MLNLDAQTAQRSRAYRAFKLDRAGRVFSAEVVPAQDDTQARRRARAMATDEAIELWDRTRFLGRYEPAVPIRA